MRVETWLGNAESKAEIHAESEGEIHVRQTLEIEREHFYPSYNAALETGQTQARISYFASWAGEIMIFAGALGIGRDIYRFIKNKRLHTHNLKDNLLLIGTGWTLSGWMGRRFMRYQAMVEKLEDHPNLEG